MKKQTFVLVHPAWHGAWLWDKVVPLLRKPGHRVSTPTLTGLGDRSHLARPEVGLDTHVNDVVAAMAEDNLENVVIVGHSSSGAVITGAADRAVDRIAGLVYLDAFVPEDGQAVFDLVAPERRQMFETLVDTEGDGWLVPRFAPPPWPTILRDMWGVSDNRDIQWVADRLVPTPVGHFKDPLHLTNASLRPPRAYVRCLRFPNARFDTHAAVARQSKGWQYRELDSGHHAVLTMPDAVANLLIELSS